MPSTLPGRELVQNFLKDNNIKITDLAKMYKLSNQDARDYVTGRKTNPAANRFILTVISDFNLRQKGALKMHNKNYYREFNKPIRKNDLDDKLLNIFIGVVILALSLLSYGFWDAIFQWI